MAIKITSTKDAHANGVKILTHGLSGAGKTTLIKTLPDPIILSAEAGLLSLADEDLPAIEITDMDSLREAYAFIRDSKEALAYQSVALDSISEISEVLLTAEKAKAKDPRQAYGALSDEMAVLVRAFRDLPGRHVYMSAKTERTQTEDGKMLWSPSMPGNKVGQSLPYFFDEVFALRVVPNAEGVNVRALMTESDGLWSAKDRSGRLDPWEPADLGAIIAKIGGRG